MLPAHSQARDSPILRRQSHFERLQVPRPVSLLTVVSHRIVVVSLHKHYDFGVSHKLSITIM
jgi:hypothetical protein